jgi:hypothetical protein
MYLIVAILILVFGYHIDSYFGQVLIKSTLRGLIALLFLSSLLKLKGKYFILILSFAVIYLYLICMPIVPPYEDQQELVLYRKVAMACSSLKEIYGPDVADHYPYLPLTLYIQIPFVLWGIDVRYLYLGLILLSGIIIYFYAPKELRILSCLLFMLLPEIFLSSLSAENHLLSIFGLLLILIFLPLRNQIPWISALFITVGFGFRQSILLILPFLLIYLLYRKEYKFILKLLILFSLLILPPILLNPYNFYLNTVWIQTGYLPNKLWGIYKRNITFNAQGVLVALGMDPKFVWEKIPWSLIQLLTYIGILMYYSFAIRRRTQPHLTFRYALIASILFIFTARKMRIYPIYYLTILLPIALWDPSKLKERQLTKKQISLIRILTTLLVCFFSANYLIAKGYQNLWCKVAKVRIIEFRDPDKILAENLSYLPRLGLSLKRGYGFMNNHEGYNFTIYLPNGEYKLKIYSDPKKPLIERNIEAIYYRYKIPIYRKGNRIFIENKEIKKLKAIEIYPL